MGNIFTILYDIVYFFVEGIMNIISNINTDFYFVDILTTTFNIYIFSDTGWFSQPITVYDILLNTLTILLLVFFIKLLWKVTKKFINMVFGVFRV